MTCLVPARTIILETKFVVLDEPALLLVMPVHSQTT